MRSSAALFPDAPLLAKVAGLVLLSTILLGCVSPSAAERQQLAGKTIVVTGASSGIGRGAAIRFGSAGANVVLAARRSQLLQEVAGELKAAGGTPLVVTTDVAEAAAIDRLAAAAVARFGRIDVWINNAGVGVIGPFWDAPVEDYSRLVDVNLKGVIYGSHAALIQFRKQGYGTLINTGSVDSEVPLAYQAVYSATKAGVLGLGRALNEELRLGGSGGIRVVTVMPWATDTPWWRHAANYSGGIPRMAAVDGPSGVVDTFVKASLHPREEMPSGWKAKASITSHQWLPDTTERISANIAHRYQIRTAPPAPPTAGALHRPMASGTGVSDGVRQRIRQEKAQGYR